MEQLNVCDRCGKHVKAVELNTLKENFGGHELCDSCYNDATNLIQALVWNKVSTYREECEAEFRNEFRMSFTDCATRPTGILTYSYKSFWDWMSGNKTAVYTPIKNSNL